MAEEETNAAAAEAVETQGLQGSLIWNDAKVYIKEFGAADSTYVWIAGLAEFQPPAQAKNLVELPYLNQVDGITTREKGSTAGGDISGTLNARNDADGIAGLEALIEAYEDQFGDYTFKWELPNGAYVLAEHCKVADCSVQGGSLDTTVSYSVSVAVNSKIKCYAPETTGGETGGETNGETNGETGGEG